MAEVIGDNKFVPSWGQWDQELIRMPGGSLLQFDYNQLSLQDYRQMQDHHQINVSLSLLTFMIAQVPWRLEGGNEEHRDKIEENLKSVWPRFIRSIAPAYWAGYSPVAIEYSQEADGMVRIKKLKDIAPELAQPHYKEVAGHGSRAGGSPTPKIKVFNGIKVHGQNRPVPVENSFWYSVLTQNGSFQGKKLLRPSFAPWYFSQIIQLYYNRYLERFGEPTIIARAPFGEKFESSVAGEPDVSAKAAMEAVAQGIRSQSSATLPADQFEDMDGTPTGMYKYTVEYLEGMMRGADFDRALSRFDEAMSLGVFSPALLYRTSDVGSYNLGETHMSVFLWMTNSLIDDLADFINNYIVHRLCDLNGWPKRHPTEGLMRFEAKNQGQETLALYRQLFQAMIQGKLAEPDLDDLSQVVGMKVNRIPEEYRTDPVQESAAPSGTDNNSLATN